MKKIFSGKYWIIVISSFLVSAGIALACADGWGEEYGASNFTPEIFADSSYAPFFYSLNYYYGIGYEDAQDSRFNDSTVNEWYLYLKQSISKETLAFLLQKASPGCIDSTALVMSGKSYVLPPALVGHAFPATKKDASLTAFIHFLQLAKKSESFALNNDANRWSYGGEEKKAVVFEASSLNKQLQTALTLNKDIFLKERYWFQLVRSDFFNVNPRTTIDAFQTHASEMPKNLMYYRTMGYCAGAYHKQKDFSKANYFYSLVYDHCNAMKTAAHYSFHPQEEADWQASLALCKDNHEKATLWQMLGIFYKDELRSIDEIYQLDPASDKLDLLLTRVVNQYEQDFASGGPSMFATAKTDSDGRALAYIQRIAAAGNTDKPWLWHMAAGYMNTMKQKYVEADNEYKKAERGLPTAGIDADQLRLLKLINQISSLKKIDEKQENSFLAELRWLRDYDNKKNPLFRHGDAYTLLKRTLSARYRDQGDLVKAECYVSDTKFYSDSLRIEKMKIFFSNPAPTPYQQFCREVSDKKLTDLYEYQAVRAAYRNRLDEAIALIKQSGTGQTTELPGNPFNARINDCHDCDFAAKKKITYSKLSFLAKLKELEDNVKAGKDVYTNATLLANGFYNMSQFGNARVFYECKVIGSGISDAEYMDTLFQATAIDMTLSSAYYYLAFAAATTDEQRAKSQYLLAKCQRNVWYNDPKNPATDTYGSYKLLDLKAVDGFAQLKKYPNTQYYKEVIAECGYFRRYLGK